jgi:hypothetical protein
MAADSARVPGAWKDYNALGHAALRSPDDARGASE